MTRQLPDEDSRAFISRLQKMVLEAEDGAAAVSALSQLFERDVEVHLNGEKLGWAWYEEHVQQFHTRLTEVEVTVTHAVRSGEVLMERHTITGVDVATDAPWVMEVMAAYELTVDDKIAKQYELTNMRAGEYVGGW